MPFDKCLLNLTFLLELRSCTVFFYYDCMQDSTPKIHMSKIYRARTNNSRDYAHFYLENQRKISAATGSTFLVATSRPFNFAMH